jgi:NAD(P)-dependent dehydrogenase (short-subunit alcohol dehydrogenase family)
MFWKKQFNPQSDISSLEGKVILVTGGNTGLGKETIRYLAAHNPEKIYLAARTESKALDAIADIKSSVPSARIIHLSLDLTSFASVKHAAQEFQSKESRLDILINNAGIMMTPYSLTKDGYEIQFGTNHMGHALLTKLLLPTLQATTKLPHADVRIVNLSSMGHMFAPRPEGIVFDQAVLEQRNTVTRYGQSKLANILFTRELTHRYPDIVSVAVHPGVIITDLYASLQVKWFFRIAFVVYKFLAAYLPGHFRDARGGALCQTWAAAGAKREDLVSGEFYVPVGDVGRTLPKAKDDGLAKKLWEWTDAEFEKKGF